MSRQQITRDFGVFWERKIRTYFKVIDFDNDGEVTGEDHETMAEQFIRVGHLDEVAAKRVRRKFAQLWDQFFAYEAKTSKVTVEVYLEALRKRGKAKLTRIIIEMFVILFDLIDINGDGVIQKDEFEKFYGIFKLDAAAAAETFKAIDTNKDGTLSADEFITAGIDFFTSDDENSPYQFLFGPLVSKEEFNTY